MRPKVLSATFVTGLHKSGVRFSTPKHLCEALHVKPKMMVSLRIWSQDGELLYNDRAALKSGREHYSTELTEAL
ncbi:MAG: hypothetical protein ACP5M4_16180, partial [Acidobacteriaceae bacterium]